MAWCRRNGVYNYPYNSSEIFGMIQFGSLYSSTDGQSLNYLGAPEDGRWVTPMQYDSVNNKIIAGYSQLYSYSTLVDGKHYLITLFHH